MGLAFFKLSEMDDVSNYKRRNVKLILRMILSVGFCDELRLENVEPHYRPCKSQVLLTSCDVSCGIKLGMRITAIKSS